MGAVFQAVHVTTDEVVAIKLIEASAERSERRNAALLQEVRAMARLDHPGIVTVLDTGTVGAAAAEASDGRAPAGSTWLAMEYVAGDNLVDRCGCADWQEVKRTLLELLDALAHAHGRRVIHRDLKPSNVLLDSTSGRVKLTDFGLAHAVGSQDADERKAVEGTPHYMAPEQIEGRWRDFGP
ncbi:MAG: serine/threonine protein kinase [Proteobacteria bacterium]|nr:serine/threonine protein kinase [Pseudomonadota bacterium]